MVDNPTVKRLRYARFQFIEYKITSRWQLDKILDPLSISQTVLS